MEPTQQPEVIMIALKEIGEAQWCDTSTLEVVDTFCQRDQDWHEENGWDSYKPDNYLRRLLPTLGEPRYYSEKFDSVVIPLAGRRYRVKILFNSFHTMDEIGATHLILELTKDPETIPDLQPPEPGDRGNHYWQFFGQPHWIQNEHFPAGPDGKPCSHFVTVENGWADAGNWNILVSLDQDGIPSRAFIEASTC